MDGVALSRVDAEIETLVKSLDERRGCIFESAYEYPGRYARWTMGFVDPPLEIAASARHVRVQALNARGGILLKVLHSHLAAAENISKTSDSRFLDEANYDPIAGVGKYVVCASERRFAEEERSKQPSSFSVIRAVIDFFFSPEDPQIGLYGAFGYDLSFQFEQIKLKHTRSSDSRDVVLYLPDELLVYDKPAREAWRLKYDFQIPETGTTTLGMPREGTSTPFKGETHVEVRRDHAPGEYAKSVTKAREEFKVGNLFETVLSQTFYEPCADPPSEIFARLRKRNPSPYMYVINLGEEEYLVGASPEMYVRAEHTSSGMRIETCPISGTIRRGTDALEDAERIREILVNKKEESELTMCTDVDRNDKSRICVPGTVRVIGRRQIEKYSKLIHTVDHVEGYLREGFDALDAFMTHMWAVTVTGSPKVWAIQFVEDNEKSQRDWYAGAVGLLGFDGGMNTGLTLRTIRIKRGVAEIRAGATLLFDSVPEAEEAETELKASAFREAVLHPTKANDGKGGDVASTTIVEQKRILVIDHQDSFVHTLASYLRSLGGTIVTTIRYTLLNDYLEEAAASSTLPHLAVMSPGPGKPSDFNCSRSVRMLIDRKIPIFGVCLGMQTMVEHFGGKLGVLKYPQHGKPATISQTSTAKTPWGVLSDLPREFAVARYHSLYAAADDVGDELVVTSTTTDGVVMSVEHKTLPISGVQFHPESILTNPKHGLVLLKTCLDRLHY